MPRTDVLVDGLNHPEGVANVVFVGAQRSQLVSANLGRWHLTLVDTGLHGVPLHHPEPWAGDVHDAPLELIESRYVPARYDIDVDLEVEVPTVEVTG